MRRVIGILFAFAIAADAQTYYEVPSTGQSLMKGACVSGCTGQKTVTAYPVTNPNKLDWVGSLENLLAEKLGNIYDESPALSAINQVTYESAGNTWRGVLNRGDVSAGAAYAALKKGSAQYTQFTDSHAFIPGAIAGIGKTYGSCPFSLNIHGEENFSNTDTSATVYAGYVAEWQHDIETDCGSSSAPMFVSQLGVWWHGGSTTITTPVGYDGVTPGVPLGQLKAARDNISKVYLVGPKYAFSDFGGTGGLPHMTEMSYVKIGEQMGHAAKTVILDGTYWTGVQLKDASVSGTTLTSNWYVQHAPLVIDTTLISNRTEETSTGSGVYKNCYGLEVVDGVSSNTVVPIASCTTGILTDGDTITLTLTRTTTGTVHLRAAYTQQTGTLDSNNALIARTNLHDSDPALGYLSGAHLYNWAPTSDDALPYTGPSYPVDSVDPRGMLTSHPRMFVNTTMADTYIPSKNKLEALIAKATNTSCALSGCAQAASDFVALRSYVDSWMGCSRSGVATTSCANGPFGYSDLQATTMVQAAAIVYLVLRGSDATSANKYADMAIGESIGSPNAYSILGWDWGDGRIQESGQPGFEGIGLALLYDAMYDRILAREQGAEPGIMAAVHAAISAQYTALSTESNIAYVRETDYHNYLVPWEAAELMLSIAAYGDYGPASTWLDSAAGKYGIDVGGTLVNPAGYTNGGVPEQFQYNLAKSSRVLSDGALNWEGTEYWRNNASPLFWGVKAYDTATNKAKDLFNTTTGLYGDTYKSGLWRIYMFRPDGRYPSIGDSSPKFASGKDQVTMVGFMEQFAGFTENGLQPSQYMKTFVDDALVPAGGGDWWDGSEFPTGLAWKLLWYDYGAITAAPYSDLPTSRQFAKDTIMRTGWGSSDTYMTFFGGYTGQYHVHLNQGDFTLFRGKDLVTQGGMYNTSQYWAYAAYFKRSVAHNVPLVYKSGECWKDNGSQCGVSGNGFSMTNDGGQRWVYRRRNPPFSGSLSGNVAQINRLWSASILESSAAPNYPEQFWLGFPKFKTHAFADYVSFDMTKAYTNADTGSGDNTDIRVTAAADSARRQGAFFRDGTVGYWTLFDKVVSADSSYPKTLPIHSPNVPKLYNGSLQTPAAGINSYSNVTYSQSDNGTARLFTSMLLPASKTVRAVGGNSCSPITIASVSNPGTDQPAVFTANSHGLVDGEWIAVQAPGGANSCSGAWCGYRGIQVFGLGGSDLQVWGSTTNTFKLMTMNGYDVIADGVSPHPAVSNFATVWPSGATISYHTNCGYEAYVDDYYSNPAETQDNSALTHNGQHNFPSGVQTNLWLPFNEAVVWTTEGFYIPRWRFEIKPTAAAATDYFLNVFSPETTSDSAPPTTATISVTGWHGAQILGASGTTYVAMFSESLNQTSVTYTATHSGTGKHLVALAPGNYSVTQGGSALTSFTVGTDGSGVFTETGGGAFVISSGSSGSGGTSSTAIQKGVIMK